MNLFNFLIAVLLLSSAISGCTRLTVRKVFPDSTAPGIRYSLPKPFFRMTPEPDGSQALEPFYLPDACSTYAIDAAAYASSYTLEVSLADGLLTKLTWKPDTSAVAEQIAKSSGNLASAAATAKKAADDARESKIADAEAEVAKAKLDVELARLEKQAADQNGDSAEKAKEALELEKARAKLAAAEAALEAAGGHSSRSAINNRRGPNVREAVPPITLYTVNEWIAPDGTPVVMLDAVKPARFSDTKSLQCPRQ
jgi:hypothetical protein